MERTQIFDLMSELKLFGMRIAYDDVMAAGIKRQHEPCQGPILANDDPVCISVDFDRTANGARLDRVFVAIEPNKAGLGNRRTRRLSRRNGRAVARAFAVLPRKPPRSCGQAHRECSFAQWHGEMRLAGPRAADENDIALLRDEAATRKIAHQDFVDGYAVKVEVVDVVHQRELGHYVPVLARKPGALRNGAPFKDWVLPSAMEKIRRKLARRASHPIDKNLAIAKKLVEDQSEPACLQGSLHGAVQANLFRYRAGLTDGGGQGKLRAASSWNRAGQ